MTTIKAVVFDIGNVLVRWDAHLAFVLELGTRSAVDAFLERTDFFARNLRADAGESFADLAAEIEAAADRALFSTYVDRYAMTIPQAIEGTWSLMERLRQKRLQIHAITNWSAETWPKGVLAHPRLGTSFGVTIVSGQERLLKPEPAIFHLLCERGGLLPADCVFVDDSLKNVEGARAIGMDAIHFESPQQLEHALQERGLL